MTTETLKIRIVRADGTWRFNRLTWEVGAATASFEHGGYVNIAQMYREGCEIKEGWISNAECEAHQVKGLRALGLYVPTASA
jgi:hypothetical protein